MKQQPIFWFWRFAAWAAVFVIVAIIGICLTQVSKFLVEIDKEPNIELKLEARAALVGNMIGAVASGLLAIGAAFGVVYYEGAERRKAARLRQQETIATLYGWVTDKIGWSSAIVGMIEDWTTIQTRSANVLERPFKRLAERKLLPKNRERAEADFPALVSIFADIDAYDVYFAHLSETILGVINGTMGANQDKREAGYVLLEILGAVAAVLGLIAKIGDQISDDEIAASARKMRDSVQASRINIGISINQFLAEQQAVQKAALAGIPNNIKPDERDHDAPPKAAGSPPDKSEP